MLPQNPYQSPQSESQSIPAVFTKHPTWKFWSLLALSAPGMLTILIEPRYSSDPILSRDWIGRNAGYLMLAALAFSAWAVWTQWPTLLTHSKSIQKFTCVISIMGLASVAATYFGHFIASMTYLVFFGNQIIRFLPPQTRLLIVASGLIAATIPASLGFALAFDAIGKPIRRCSKQSD